MIITIKLNPEDKPTEEQLKRIKEAAKLPIVPDEDCPVYTANQLACLYALSTGRVVSENCSVGA
jgi:hypothetical protein